MQIMQGMNIEAVRGIGRQLASEAAALEGVRGHVDALTSQASQEWRGQDSQQFNALWHSGARTKLVALIQGLQDLARKAAANADAQHETSSTLDGGGPVQSVQDTRPTPGGGPDAAGRAAAERAVELPLPGSDRTWQQVQADYDRDYVNKYHLWADGGPNGDNRYQCVSWAWYRMRELGYEGAQVRGDGGVLAGNLGGTQSTLPKAGAVISSQDGGYGHVMIAEQVVTNEQGRLQVKVSEMNAGGDGVAAHPNEYRCDKVFVRNDDGTWSQQGAQAAAPRHFTVFNPTYP